MDFEVDRPLVGIEVKNMATNQIAAADLKTYRRGHSPLPVPDPASAGRLLARPGEAVA